ncbi:McrB family protein [uncultured Flavobacterium sp.]|uniref:McrB family protein n=1 Tax=uncultured Flavobacterium sp. TaxID=165435 RepID=UPI0012285F08|nr:AAA family ATPase [uncultured Flavobacterium sp.]THD34254.1 MAG: hypothetical protein DI588_03665 [Flavobacterium johnsoniae]
MTETLEDKIIKISEEILNILLDYKKQNPDFTFSLRQRDSAQSKDKRLEKGFWFQGSNYIYVPLFRKGDNARKIKTIGFVIGFEGDNIRNYIEISFKSGSNETEKAFYKELAAFINLKLNKENFGKHQFPNNNYIKNLEFYLSDFRNKALELLDNYSLKSQFLISESEFNRTLNKINDIKDKLSKVPREINGKKYNSNPQNSDMKTPLNQILYGPPGTGKTYKLLNDYYSHFEVHNKTVSKKEYEFDVVSKLNWWQVFALVLLETPNLAVPDIKKHRFVDYKLQVSNTKSLSQTVWGQLSAHTIINSNTVKYDRRTEPLIFDKSSNSIWKIVDSEKEQIEDLIEIYNEIKEYKEVKKTSSNHRFITFHQSFSYEDFIEGIKPVIDKESNNETSDVSYTIEKGVFYECCNEAAKLAGFLGLKDAIENYTQEQRDQMFKTAPPYGLFIDEINRGNISQIFGELITLIEDNKRLGKSEIIVELPYSKDKFGVPPNLHIIGTMNTADRSIEALDTALRRRFCFEEMLPKTELLSPSAMYCRLLWDYENVEWEDSEFVGKENNLFLLLGVSQDFKDKRKDKWEQMREDRVKEKNDYFNEFDYSGINLELLLKTINKRIEILLNRDHTIGHSYFMSVNSFADLQNTFKNNIIPLLQEYFYGDYEKIGMILGAGFFDDAEKYDNKLFAKFPTQNYPEGGSFLRLKTINENFNIIGAIETLLGNN